MEKSKIIESNEVRFKGEIFENCKIDLNKLCKSLYGKHKESKSLFIENYDLLACEVLDVKYTDLVSKSRNQKLVWCRYFCYYYLNKNGFKSTEISKRFNRLHCTVLHGLTRHNYLLIDKEYILYFNEFKRKIKEHETKNKI